MARVTKRHNQMKRKGESGAAKNYITRTKAIKKLQCTLADFRRLCILKGIYPRQPNNVKKANNSSTAPTTFYYTKDIQHLLHSPYLAHLRSHKALAKKISKALGRGEYSLAKNLDQQRDQPELGSIIKERYPTLNDALEDMDDALSLLFLFAALPSSLSIPAEITQHCTKLVKEWMVFLVREKAVRKVFVSVKGVWVQAEVRGVPVTWIMPHVFTQNLPSDLDTRILLTFLELYQSLVSFILFALYSSSNLIYPPKLDLKAEENGGGLAVLLLENKESLTVEKSNNTDEKKKIRATDVRNSIKQIASTTAPEVEEETHVAKQVEEQVEEEDTLLFAGLTFHIGRETPRSLIEFLILSQGGQVVWDDATTVKNPNFKKTSITHYIVDRPPASIQDELTSNNPNAVLVQPQYVFDSLNSKALLPTDLYAPGKVLPPHLSPFVVDEANRIKYDPTEQAAGSEGGSDSEEASDDESDVEMDEDDEETPIQRPAWDALVAAHKNETPNAEYERILHEAELEAEVLGLSLDLSSLPKRKTASKTKAKTEDNAQKQAQEMMLTGKKKKIYQKMEGGRKRAQEEKERLQKRAADLKKVSKKK